MKITDLIVSRILALMDQQEGTAEIQRNELASLIGCVPSQISYVTVSYTHLDVYKRQLLRF